MNIEGIAAAAVALVLVALYLIAVVNAGQLLEDLVRRSRGLRPIPVETRDRRR